VPCALLAIPQVSAWISRGAVPTAVRATAQCVEWLMQYSAHTAAAAASAASWSCPSAPSSRGAVHLPSSSSVPPPAAAAASPTSAQMLRMSGAMCLQRLVNGLVDPLQKRAHAMSVASLARLLQLPPSFVELRHEAAHGPELPTLAVIQSSCKRAVAWLRQQYWRPQVCVGVCVFACTMQVPIFDNVSAREFFTSTIICDIFSLLRAFESFAIVRLQRIHHRRNDRDSLRDALISFHAAQRQSAAQHSKALAAHKSKHQQHQQRLQSNSADRIGDEAAFEMVSAQIPCRSTLLLSLLSIFMQSFFWLSLTASLPTLCNIHR
jgi:hypothetical protein